MSPDYVRRVCALSGCARSTLLAYHRDPSLVREASKIRIERAIRELRRPDNDGTTAARPAALALSSTPRVKA